MNRKYRRAQARTKHHPISREPLHKYSHKITRQTCALWVPDARGYLTAFSPTGFRVVEFAELARHYDEDEAASAAINFYEVTGFRVAVRPVYCHHA